jgi:hypothetical protein
MHRALVALGLALLALAPASCVFVPFVPPCPVDVSRLSRSAALMRASEQNSQLPPQLPQPPRRHVRQWPPLQTNATRLDRPERMLVELLSALLQTDDVTLLERDTQAMGVAYLDTNFTMCRPPLLLRNSVRDIMHRYGLPMIPLERKWTRVPGNETVDTIDAEFL